MSLRPNYTPNCLELMVTQGKVRSCIIQLGIQTIIAPMDFQVFTIFTLGLVSEIWKYGN